MRVRLAVVAVACALLAGCAAHRQQVPAAQSEYAIPKRNPEARATAQEPLEANAVDFVSMKAAVFDTGPAVAFVGLEWRDLLRPALSPADALEAQRAYEGCTWNPWVGPNGEPTVGTFVFAVRRR